MGAKQRIMGACGCGEEEKRKEVAKEAAKKPWFKGKPADIKKAKEAGAVVVVGPCAATAKPLKDGETAKDGEGVFIQGCPDKLKAAGVEAPKAADATETTALEKNHPASEEAAPAPASEAEAAKPEDAVK